MKERFKSLYSDGDKKKFMKKYVDEVGLSMMYTAFKFACEKRREQGNPLTTEEKKELLNNLMITIENVKDDLYNKDHKN